MKPPRSSIADTILTVLRHPLSVLTGVAGGLLLGLYASPLAVLLKPAADAYVTLLSMCLLPILVREDCARLDLLQYEV